MTNFGAKILNNAIGSLLAQQAVIGTTGNNIANVNTPGYTRREISLETRIQRGSSGVLNVGNGVQVGNIVRIADAFLEKSLREATSDTFSYGVEKEFLSRAEAFFSLTESGETIGTTLANFFTAVNDLALNPASIELRKNLIERSTDLVSSIKSTYAGIADLQAEADARIATEINTVNGLTAQIADLNQLIVNNEATGFEAADERDQRTRLLEQLSEKISFSMVENSEGSVLVTLAGGLPLVAGSVSRNLEVTEAPSFAPGALPPSLGGGVLSYIVYDFDAGPGSAHVDLTQSIQEGGGTLAGLLRMRGINDASSTSAFEANGTLVEIGARIEGLARGLLTTLNQTYLGPDENSGVAGLQPSAGDLDGNTPSVYGLFTFEYSGARDVDADGIPDDLTNVALGIDNFASILQVAISDPRDVAAARDVNATVGATSFPPGEGSNMLALATLQSQNNTFTLGSYSFTGTFEESYNETVAHVGAEKLRADVNARVSEDIYISAQNRKDQVSGVSLDEEFTSLIQAQKAFQASARMVKIADGLLDEIIGLI